MIEFCTLFVDNKKSQIIATISSLSWKSKCMLEYILSTRGILCQQRTATCKVV